MKAYVIEELNKLNKEFSSIELIYPPEFRPPAIDEKKTEELKLDTSIDIEITPIDMYDICSFLRRHKAHKSPRYMKWILEPGNRIRILFEPWGKELELNAIDTLSGLNNMSFSYDGLDWTNWESFKQRSIYYYL